MSEIDNLDCFADPTPKAIDGYLAWIKEFEIDIKQLEEEKKLIRKYRKYRDCRDNAKQIIIDLDEHIEEIKCKIRHYLNFGQRLRTMPKPEENEENPNSLPDLLF